MGRIQDLLDAARGGDRRAVEKILAQITKKSGPFTNFSLRRDAGVNAQDNSGYTPLHHACMNKHKEIVGLLLSADATPCMVDKEGATPLYFAASNGNTEIVRMLLAHNNPPINVNQLTKKRESALLIAAQFGHTDVVALLIAKGADVTIKNIKDETALDLAAQFGKVKTVEHLLRACPQLIDQYRLPASRNIVFTSTPLHRASTNGHWEVVLELIEAGMDPNIRTQSGTPLHEATRFGKSSVVRKLLKKGADLHAQDRYGRTVYNLLDEYSGEAYRKVKKFIREHENYLRASRHENEDDLPPFPVHDISPTVMKAPEIQKNTNKNDSLLSTTSSFTKKYHPQNVVKKLASKCLGFKAKFNSAPNISDSTRLESEIDVKFKNLENKSNTSTLLIGNSKFFKILAKKDESGDIVCNDEFDTISLDRLGTLNRDSVVNRSNRSCPGFKTSLPNISENNELSDSHESIADSVVITELICDKTDVNNLTEAVNYNTGYNNIFEPRKLNDCSSLVFHKSEESATLVNECYESYEFTKNKSEKYINSFPRPLPRPNTATSGNNVDNIIYENVTMNMKQFPTPAVRTHLPKTVDIVEKQALYENIPLKKEKHLVESPKSSTVTVPIKLYSLENDSSPSVSRTSTLSSDSMIDESYLEDILLSEKSKSFRHSKESTFYTKNTNKSNIYRTQSNASDTSGVTEVSAIENVDCSGDLEEKSIYLSMTGTLPNQKSENFGNKKVLFRHKTFTNIEVDRNSIKITDLPQWNKLFLRESLPHYHIRGTGHCIYKGPTVQEFLNIFNSDTLSKNKRNSYFETAICFCRPKPPKHHSSAEDLLDISSQDEEKASIDVNALKSKLEIASTTFKCFCDSGACTYHSKRRESPIDIVVKFSAIKKSISTPDITLDFLSPIPDHKSSLPKNKTMSYNFEEPYAVVNVKDILANDKSNIENIEPNSSMYVTMSQPSTMSSSSSSARPYSIKDITEAISLKSHSTSTTTSLSSASDSVHLPLRKSSSSEYSGHWSLQSCNSNVTIKSDASFKTCLEESSDEDSDGTLHSDAETSDAETVKSDISTTKKPWIHSDSFRFGNNSKPEIDAIIEESQIPCDDTNSLEFEYSKFESGISVEGSDSSSSGCEDDSGVPRVDADLSLDGASLERGSGTVGGVCSGSGRRRWDEVEGTSEGDALSISSAASSCAPLHLAHHYEYSKVSPTPPKKPPRRNLSVSPTHANSPSSGYSYELRPHARSQDDLDDLQGAKHYLKHGRSVDQYVDSKLSYSEYEENHNSPRVIPVPNPRPSLKQRPQPVAITAMYENIVIKEQNPRRKLRRNNIVPTHDNYDLRMNDNRIRKYSNQEKSSLESLLDDQSMNSPSECERYYDGPRASIPLSPTHYVQPATPDHPPPSAKQAENSIHERIRPLSQLIMEVVEEIRIRKKSQSDVSNS